MPRLYNGVHLVDGPCLPNVARIDHGAIPMILSMMSNGIQVDLDRFAKMDKELTLDMDRITEEVKIETGYYCNLNSGDQIANLLFNKMGLKQARFKLTPGGSRESVEEQVLTAIQHEHPVIPKIQHYKEFSKLKGTYVAPMPKLAVHVGHGIWRMFPNLPTTRVPSGRLACNKPNLLAMPTRTERGKDIRRCFVAADGWKIVSIDYSQIEPRVTAHRSMDDGLLRIYRNGEDIYSDFAIAAFKIPDKRYQDEGGKWQYPGVDKMLHRYAAKTCVLATFYDVTAKGLLEQMPVVCASCHVEASEHTKKSPRCGFRSFWNENKCQDLINSFYLKYPGVLEMRAEDHHRLRQKGYLWDMWGRILHVAAVRSVLRWVVNAALREAGNFPIQCLSPDTIVVQDKIGPIPISNLVGNRVTLWDGEQWSTGTVVKSNIKKRLKITLFDGLSIECSPDHKLLVTNTRGHRRWSKAGDLTLSRNTRVCISGPIEKWNWPTPAVLRGRDRNSWTLEWVKDQPALFGEMLGRIASDGSVCRSSRDGQPKVVYMLVAEHEEEILPLLQKAAGLTCKYHTTIQQKSAEYAPLYRIEIYSKGLASTLLSWGIKERVPLIAWSNPLILKAYLRGMFDGDGGVTGLGSPLGGRITLAFGANNGKEGLAKGIQLALLALGIRSRLKFYKTSIRLSIQKRCNDRFMLQVGFINSSKIAKGLSIESDSPLKSPAYGDAIAIREIMELPPVCMIDFINSTTSSFSAGGITVHNSGAQGCIKLSMAAIQDDLEDSHMLDVAKPILQLHDELIFEARDDVVEDLFELVKWRFETGVPLNVPIKAGEAVAQTWGDLPK